MKRSLILPLGLVGLLGGGCDQLAEVFGTGGSSSDPPEDGSGGSDMFSRDNYLATTNADGIYDVDVDLSGSQSSFLVTVESGKYPTLERVIDPDGNEVLNWEDWYDSSESLTYAFYVTGNSMAFNWPVRQEDGPLKSGKWTVEVSTISGNGYYAGNTDIEVTVDKKADSNLTDAEVNVVIVWADGVGTDDTVTSAVYDAVEHWREIWAAFGITLNESYATSTLDPDLAFYSTGSSDAEANAEQFNNKEIIVVIGETIDGYTDIYGVAGGIPGSIEPNPYSFVVISWLAHAGGNGTFSQAEIELMGETMAHETGHYKGLFHPWEIDSRGNPAGYYDALDDTENCTSWQQCESVLGSNLMAPYPVCSGASCISQTDETAGQQGVEQRYTGAL